MRIIITTLIILMLLISPVSAQYIYHEVTIHVVGEYNMRSVGGGNISVFEGVGEAHLHTIRAQAPETAKVNWWDLF